MSRKKDNSMGQALKVLRISTGLSTKETADVTGIDESAVIRIEEGKKPGKRQLEKLFAAYGFTLIPIKKKEKTEDSEPVKRRASKKKKSPSPSISANTLCLLYTDGSAVPNPGKGAWAYVLLAGDTPIDRKSGFFPSATNNEMELTAMINGLKTAYEKGVRHVSAFSDSQYVVYGITRWVTEWLKQDPSLAGRRNAELWLELVRLSGLFETITFTWVKGHNGNRWNEMCDGMCTAEYSSRGLPSQDYYNRRRFS